MLYHHMNAVVLSKSTVSSSRVAKPSVPFGCLEGGTRNRKLVGYVIRWLGVCSSAEVY